jgi:hypothetical protein
MSDPNVEESNKIPIRSKDKAACRMVSDPTVLTDLTTLGEFFLQQGDADARPRRIFS